jgi:hypothetical protein
MRRSRGAVGHESAARQAGLYELIRVVLDRPPGAARDQLGLAVTRAQAFLNPEVLVMIWIARSTTRPGRGARRGADHASLLRQKAFRRYPIRTVTTPVPVEGGVAGGGLPMRAGSSFHGRRKPNGSAFHRRIMAGVQEEAKHAISAMSPLKSCEVEKPQPQR